jgi:hypothetical protein
MFTRPINDFFHQDIAEFVAVPLHANMTPEEIAERLNLAIEDYDRGVYDERIRRAYCAARRKFSYLQIIDRIIEPAFEVLQTFS